MMINDHATINDLINQSASLSALTKQTTLQQDRGHHEADNWEAGSKKKND